MLDEQLQEMSALYAAGLLAEVEREQFELLLAAHPALRREHAGIADLGASLLWQAASQVALRPPAALRARVLEQIATHPQVIRRPGIVMSGADGCVQWVNGAFTEMCGYSLEELRGKRLGPILQGPGTDRATAERMRRAVHDFEPCREAILNYHKNGHAYWVDIEITPIRDASGAPAFFVAREREMTERLAA
jgi:PAS domain S-box-containing protein